MFIRSLLAAAVIGLSLGGAALAHDYKVGNLKIDHPWSRATPGGAKVAGGFMKITNTGSTPDRLIGGTALVSNVFEVHEMAVTDGVMKMRHLEKGLEIAPGATVELKPGGFHVMFIDLKQPLVEGERIKGTLVFEKAGTIEIEYAVEKLGTAAPGGGHDHSGHDMKKN